MPRTQEVGFGKFDATLLRTSNPTLAVLDTIPIVRHHMVQLYNKGTQVDKCTYWIYTGNAQELLVRL